MNVLYSLPSEPLFGIHLSCPFTWPGQQARGINGPVLSMSPLTDSHPLHWVWLDKWRNGSSTAHSSVYWDDRAEAVAMRWLAVGEVTFALFVLSYYLHWSVISVKAACRSRPKNSISPGSLESSVTSSLSQSSALLQKHLLNKETKKLACLYIHIGRVSF